LEVAEQNSLEDHHLAFMCKSEFTDFFKKQLRGKHWDYRLNCLRDLDLARSPLFEALMLFGSWQTNKCYPDGIKSAKKFEEMEKIALDRKWYWTLPYCIETATYIYKTFAHRSELASISERICKYLDENKEALPPRAILHLVSIFNSIIVNACREDIDKVFKLLVDFSHKKLTADLFNFMRDFLFKAIEISHFLKIDSQELKLHNEVIETWIEEANFKGSSKIVRYSLLKQALDYSAKIGIKEKIEILKKEISGIDFSDELKEIRLPPDEQKKYEQAMKSHMEKMTEAVETYTKHLTEMPGVAATLNLCTDKGLIRLNVQKTKEFVKELMAQSVGLQIFSQLLDTGNKVMSFHTNEEKEQYQLNQQLVIGINETLWMIDAIFEKLEQNGSLSSNTLYEFLAKCDGLSEEHFRIANSGIIHHMQKDFVASVSILTPLVEGTMTDFLKSINADTSSYEGAVIEQRELGGLLNQKEVNEQFGEDFQYFLKLFLVEPDSFNFRNRFAHAQITPLEFNHKVSTCILFIVLKICSKTYKGKYQLISKKNTD
jgi:hypothetical protein